MVPLLILNRARRAKVPLLTENAVYGSLFIKGRENYENRRY